MSRLRAMCSAPLLARIAAIAPGRAWASQRQQQPHSAMTLLPAEVALLLLTLLALAATPARAAGLFSFAASGTISFNSTGDSTIPIGTPWTFELIYDTAAPDLAPADPTFGSFTNGAAPPALTFFHYQAGSYEVTIADPAAFGTGSEILITFTAVHAIDININAPALFPPLAGGDVSFHADFNAVSSVPIFSSDALPTNTALGAESFDVSSVTLLPPNSVVTSSSLTSLMLTAVPEPGTLALLGFGLVGLGAAGRRASTRESGRMCPMTVVRPKGGGHVAHGFQSTECSTR